MRVVPLFNLTCNVDSPEKQNFLGNEDTGKMGNFTDGVLVIADGCILGTPLRKEGARESDGAPVVDGCILGTLLTEGAGVDGATVVDGAEVGGNISPIMAVAKSWLALIITSARPR
jgi:hypothetical protein